MRLSAPTCSGSPTPQYQLPPVDLWAQDPHPLGALTRKDPLRPGLGKAAPVGQGRSPQVHHEGQQDRVGALLAVPCQKVDVVPTAGVESHSRRQGLPFLQAEGRALVQPRIVEHGGAAQGRGDRARGDGGRVDHKTRSGGPWRTEWGDCLVAAPAAWGNVPGRVLRVVLLCSGGGGEKILLVFCG